MACGMCSGEALVPVTEAFSKDFSGPRQILVNPAESAIPVIAVIEKLWFIGSIPTRISLLNRCYEPTQFSHLHAGSAAG